MKCRAADCGVEIVFAVSPKGKSLPVDAVSNPEGEYVIAGTTPQGTPLLVRADPETTAPRYTSHYKTCTSPNRFTKKGK